MTKLELNLRGYAILALTSAAPEHCLNRLTEEKIPFWNAASDGPLTIRICVPYGAADAISAMADTLQAEITVIKRVCGYRYPLRWLKRPFLIFSLVAAIFVTFVLPDYVWVITVNGNKTIPTEKILQALDEIGIRFGVKNDTIVSQQVKNQLLNLVDGLQWAAVNCSGGHCQVLVRERDAAPELQNRTSPADVVASTDGTITEMRVLAGQPVCQVGDTVDTGALLVSGVTDWGVAMQQSRAEAEIYALTWHSQQSATPAQYKSKTGSADLSVSRFLQLGRFRIKISGNSRICVPGCAKIVIREIMTLPGGFQLPISRITETVSFASTETKKLSPQDAAALLLNFGTAHTEASMIAGRVLSEDHDLTVADGLYRMDTVYACREMIARERTVNLFGSEQIYGRTNSERGTD